MSGVGNRRALSRWLSAVASMGGCLARRMEMDGGVPWGSSSDGGPKAALLDTSHRQVADPPAKCLSAWGRTV